ncbi:hypothetical protein BDN70DRAFT_807063 [Pholiota conissans]|uniref:Uncharacterized protein n=1 Tax=Pholiota conissans TaxID=109636 RepID=A0A9P5Z341_9AGAR|nr:hypothetical protein BDN70DRAFT_807063 [Pholiota conissans]
MGFSRQGVWLIGYCGPMGYGLQIPAHQAGGSIYLWVIRGYGLSGVWVMRGSTVATVTNSRSYTSLMMRDVSHRLRSLFSATFEPWNMAGYLYRMEIISASALYIPLSC